MKRSIPTVRSAGLSYVEVLTASAVCTLCLSVMIQLWSFSLQLSLKNADIVAAYNLARQTIETLKETGFSQTPEAPQGAPIIHYFDIADVNRDASSAIARYCITTTVVSDALVAGSNPPSPAAGALRLVTVTVTLVPTGASICRMTSYLARQGI